MAPLFQGGGGGREKKKKKEREIKTHTQIWKPLRASNCKTIANVELPLPPPCSSEMFPVLPPVHGHQMLTATQHPWVHSGAPSTPCPEERENQQ